MPTHVRFEDNDEEGDPMAFEDPGGCVAVLAGGQSSVGASCSHQPVLTSGAASNSGATRLKPACSLRTDYNTQDQCYVFDVVQSPASSSSFAASCSNHRIKLYNAVQGGDGQQLRHVGDLAGHTATITGLCFPDPVSAPQHLASSSYDGTVRGWDCRANTQVESFSAPGNELYSLSASEHLLAAGADGKVLFWDRRTRKALGCYGDTHANEVTQVIFHPGQRHTLLTGSVDGLVAVFDMAQGLDEDEGFKAALNIDTSCARMGFYGPDGERLWITTHTETFHLWQWRDACDEQAEGGNGALADCHDAREQLTAVAAGVFETGLDYLVQAQYDEGSGRLLLSAGTSSGAAALFPVNEPTVPAAAAGPLFGPPVAVLPADEGGHSAVVRALLCAPGSSSSSGPVILTGGEDSRICCWVAGQQQHTPPAAAADGRAVRRSPKHSKKHGPY